MKDTIIEIAIAGIVFAYFGYGTVKTIREYRKYKEDAEQYKENHKDAELYRRPAAFTVFIGCVCVLCVVLAIFAGYMADKQVSYYRIAYIGIAILFAGLIFESIMKRQVYFTEDGFFLDDMSFRYRMIEDFKIRKGMVKNVKIHFADGREMEVPRKVGYEIQNRYDAWKENRKK